MWDSIMEMGRHGALPNGGCRRLALTREDQVGRDLFVRWAKEAGCAVSVDEVGNIYARRDGQDPDLPAVATGSHLDTQPHGGRFDGIYGVLAGLEVVRALNDNHIKTQKPVDVIVWTNEEAVRFPPPLTGSQVFAGKLKTEDVHRTLASDGALVKDELVDIGYYGSEIPGARKLDSFIEAHIEQGPVLEKEAKTIGVVDCVQGAFAAEVTLAGEDGHAGTVQLDMRRDACLGAAQTDGGMSGRYQGHRNQRAGPQLPRGEEDVQLATVRVLSHQFGQFDQLVGRIAHGADHGHDAVASVLCSCDSLGDVPDLACIGQRTAAVLLDNQCHSFH